jgi:ribose 5-phosphate isomerase B
MKICIGCDHAAFDEKEVLKAYLSTKYEVVDMGTHSLDRCNYPDYGIAVVKKVLKEDFIGILICGSGIGVSMVANRFRAGFHAKGCDIRFTALMREMMPVCRAVAPNGPRPTRPIRRSRK